jgi:hypothetical protein
MVIHLVKQFLVFYWKRKLIVVLIMIYFNIILLPTPKSAKCYYVFQLQVDEYFSFSLLSTKESV